MYRTPQPPRPVEAALVVPAGFFAILLLGAVAASVPGHLAAPLVVAATAAIVAVLAWQGEPGAALPLAGLGWFSVAGFSRAPFGQLHVSGTAGPGAIVLVAALAGAVLGHRRRRRRNLRSTRPVLPRRAAGTLDSVTFGPSSTQPQPARRRIPVVTATAAAGTRRSTGLSRRRQLLALVIAAVLLPSVTLVLAAARTHLAFPDELLVFLLAVLAVTMVGGFWPALLAAVAAGLLLNWYFTPPFHTWTIDAPQNLFALILFVASAVTVSSVVHLAARRDAEASRRASEAATLLELARTVLSGADTPAAVLEHLYLTFGVRSELQERVADRWVRVAGGASDSDARAVAAGSDLRLVVYGEPAGASMQVLDGYAAQAAAASERQRLRIQAGQAEALAEGNRMRTALLAAVSHDLRSPLASVKAAVGSLRQTDVAWTPDDRASLLATIEEGADRLDSLIGNLLDMSRVQAGALQPFVRSVALDEVAPLVVHGLEGAEQVTLAIPDTLPLMSTDPGLLERALANLVANAIRYSPPGRPPVISGRATGDGFVAIDVVDHGPGIPAGERHRVFEPFQQLGDRHTSGGVGLGLAVAKGFVEGVGGRITASTTPGGGLTMRVEIPVAARQPDPAGSDR